MSLSVPEAADAGNTGLKVHQCELGQQLPSQADPGNSGRFSGRPPFSERCGDALSRAGGHVYVTLMPLDLRIELTGGLASFELSDEDEWLVAFRSMRKRVFFTPITATQ